MSEDLESAQTLDSGYVVICMSLAGAKVLCVIWFCAVMKFMSTAAKISVLDYTALPVARARGLVDGIPGE